TTIGVVEQITFRSTRLLLGSGEIIVHPNRYMTASKIVNYARNRRLRVRVPVRIDRDQSIDRTRAVLLALTMGDGRIAADAPPQVVVTGIAQGRISLSLQFWIDDESQEMVLVQ